MCCSIGSHLPNSWPRGGWGRIGEGGRGESGVGEGRIGEGGECVCVEVT